MSAVIAQLLALGAHDAFLSENPSITYFRCAHSTYTHFALDEQAQPFDGNGNFKSGHRVHCTIPRIGDLLTKTMCEIKLPALGAVSDQDAAQASYINNVGFYLIRKATLLIGNQEIDSLYADYMNCYHELTRKAGKELGEMVGRYDTLAERQEAAENDQTLYVPLPWHFTMATCAALPLIALQYHNVVVRIHWNDWSKAHNSTLADAPKDNDVRARMICGYVYLSQQERVKFASGSIEMLIGQVQQMTEKEITSKSESVDMNFNHAVQELIWCLTEQSSDPLDYGDKDVLETIQVKINNVSRIGFESGDHVPARYFRTVQPYDHHSSIPDQKVYCYSFALYPEKVQPSGSLNFSRLDRTVLEVKMASDAFDNGESYLLRMYARSWNVFRISVGIGGLAFAN